MKLWRISQSVNSGWDTYSDAVVAARTEADAKDMNPAGVLEEQEPYYAWCHPKHVKVEYLGNAVKATFPGVICASFHAG
jgi:hypothetical protein